MTNSWEQREAVNNKQWRDISWTTFDYHIDISDLDNILQDYRSSTNFLYDRFINSKYVAANFLASSAAWIWGLQGNRETSEDSKHQYNSC